MLGAKIVPHETDLLCHFPIHTARVLPYFNAFTEPKEGFAEEVAEYGDREGDGVETWIAAQLPEDGGSAIDLDSSC